jgi:hypothetical protein
MGEESQDGAILLLSLASAWCAWDVLEFRSRKAAPLKVAFLLANVAKMKGGKRCQ